MEHEQCFFELNGQPREIRVQDFSAQTKGTGKEKADPQNDKQIGASMPGSVVKVLVREGDTVKKGEHLIVTEAMKMETTVQSPCLGKITRVLIKEGDQIQSEDLLLEFE